MNENLDLTKILDGCPEYTPFYSQVFGTVLFIRIETCLNGQYIVFALYDHGVFSVDSKGKYAVSNDSTELDCIVFPSKNQRDWSKFVRFWDEKSLDKPVTEKFDPKALHPFDKVLARSRTCDCWNALIFSHMDFKHKAVCCEFSWEQCIPYNEETKDLVGTNEDCPEHYIWWEEQL